MVILKLRLLKAAGSDLFRLNFIMQSAEYAGSCNRSHRPTSANYPVARSRSRKQSKRSIEFGEAFRRPPLGTLKRLEVTTRDDVVDSNDDPMRTAPLCASRLLRRAVNGVENTLPHNATSALLPCSPARVPTIIVGGREDDLQQRLHDEQLIPQTTESDGYSPVINRYEDHVESIREIGAALL